MTLKLFDFFQLVNINSCEDFLKVVSPHSDRLHDIYIPEVMIFRSKRNFTNIRNSKILKNNFFFQNLFQSMTA